MEENENNMGHYSVIPTRILFNEMQVIITFEKKFKVDPKTISSWISDLRDKNFIKVEILRNENKRIIQRKIYINEVLYPLNNDGVLPKDKLLKDTYLLYLKNILKDENEDIEDIIECFNIFLSP